MRVISEVNPEIVARHLKATHSSVDLPFALNEYRAFHIAMDEGDEERIVLWWENEKGTKDLSCRLVDSSDSVGTPHRVNSFINGDGKQFQPADLRTLANKEAVAVTNDLNGNFWYLIDGSHRSIAQFRSGKSFQDVKLYVCVHPQMMSWPYVPNYHKQRRARTGEQKQMRTPGVCQTCGGNIELLKLKDDVWARAGYSPSATACIECVEIGLGRPLSPNDVDRTFPWWKADRPEYYAGLTDGMDLKLVLSDEKLYVLGHELGSRIAGNRQFIVRVALNEDSPVIFKLNVSTYSNFDLVQSNPTMQLKDEYDTLAVLDTGSRQCLMMPGLFADRHFGGAPLRIDMVDSSRQGWDCRGQIFWLTFKSGNRTKTIEIPVYEMPFGTWPAGTLLIGRTLLDQAIFTYDGIGRKASLAFADDADVKL